MRGERKRGQSRRKKKGRTNAPFAVLSLLLSLRPQEKSKRGDKDNKKRRRGVRHARNRYIFCGPEKEGGDTGRGEKGSS